VRPTLFYPGKNIFALFYTLKIVTGNEKCTKHGKTYPGLGPTNNPPPPKKKIPEMFFITVLCEAFGNIG
jgi:hypothetical protein